MSGFRTQAKYRSVLFAAALWIGGGLFTAQPVSAQYRFEADWLYWRRENQANGPLLTGPNATNAGNVSTNYQPGFRLNLGGTVENYEIEGVFTQFENWGATALGTLTSPLVLDNSANVGNHIGFTNALFKATSSAGGLTPADPLFAGATTRLHQSTRMKDYELNIGSNRNERWWRVGIGYRRINFNDAGQYTISGTMDDAFGAPGNTVTSASLTGAGLTLVNGPGNGFDVDNPALNGADTLTADFNGQGKNTLDGVQAIFGARLFPGEWLTIDSTVKAGLFSNNAQGTVTETYVGPEFNGSAYQRTLTNRARSATFAGGVGLKATMALTDYINATAGYEAMFLSGVALGNDQYSGISNSVTNVQSYHVRANGHTILHGVTLGVELLW